MKWNSSISCWLLLLVINLTCHRLMAQQQVGLCFTQFNNTNVRGGFNQPLITSEDACKSACLSNQSCVGVDWNNVDNGCWFATNATDPTKYNQNGITHYDLNRTCVSVSAGSTGATTVPTIAGGSSTTVLAILSTSGQTTLPASNSTATSTGTTLPQTIARCFTQFNNTHTRGGLNQPLITSEDACKSACFSNPSCVGFDWNNVNNGCWFATNATDPTKYNQNGITHYDLNRTCNAGVSPITSTATQTPSSNSTSPNTGGCFTRYNDTNVRGGFNQPSITSEDACKSACLSNQFCAGVDWNNVNSGCWFATYATDPTKYNQTGITHYDLNRTCIAGLLSTISTATATPLPNSTSSTPAFCFTRYNDTNVRGGFNQPLITSEDACKSACLSNQSCAGVDWNNVNSGCWFATNATNPTKYNQTGITHYDLNRTCSAGQATLPTSNSTATGTATTLSQTSGTGTGTTIPFTVSGSTSNPAVACFTRYNDTNVRGGFNQPLITSEDACKSACLSNQSCVGVDWNNVNNGCWFATNSTDPTKYNQTGITHYDLNTTCIAGQTTVSPSNTSVTPQTPGPPSATPSISSNRPTTFPSSTAGTPAWCFTRYNDTNVRGGFNQPSITSEDACKSACLSNQSCVGVDWNNENNGCWFATNATDPTKYNQTGITHYDLNTTCNTGPSVTSTPTNSSNTTTLSSISGTPVTNQGNTTGQTTTGTARTGGSTTARMTTATVTTQGISTVQMSTGTVPTTIPPLAGCTYNWTLTNNTHVTMASLMASVTTETGCLHACENNSTCLGVDWNVVNSQCWFMTNTTDPTKISQQDINHWDLTRFCLDDSSVDCPNVWSLTSDAYSKGTRMMWGPASNETECRAACFSNPNCTGIDWTGSDNVCYLDVGSVITGGPGGANAHWDLTRRTNASCPTVCNYSWTILANKSVSDSVPFNAADENQCRLACIRAWPNCNGLDYTNATGACLLTMSSTTMMDSPGTRHWSLGYSTPCGPCTNVWPVTYGVMDRNRVLVKSLMTVSDCRTACTNLPSCTGVEFANNQCYLSTSNVFFVSLDGGFHTDIIRSTCGSGCSGSWLFIPNTRSTERAFFGSNTTELDCKNACVYDVNCTGINYNVTGGRCYLAYPGNTSSATGINHFERIRDLTCVPSPNPTTLGPMTSTSSSTRSTPGPPVTSTSSSTRSTPGPPGCQGNWSQPINDASSFACDGPTKNSTLTGCQNLCLTTPPCNSINFNTANHSMPYDCYLCNPDNGTFPQLYYNPLVVTYQLYGGC